MVDSFIVDNARSHRRLIIIAMPIAVVVALGLVFGVLAMIENQKPPTESVIRSLLPEFILPDAQVQGLFQDSDVFSLLFLSTCPPSLKSNLAMTRAQAVEHGWTVGREDENTVLLSQSSKVESYIRVCLLRKGRDHSECYVAFSAAKEQTAYSVVQRALQSRIDRHLKDHH